MQGVYQRVVHPKNGDCMQAAFATLLGLEYDDVPDFVEKRDEWFTSLYEFLQLKGIDYLGNLKNPELYTVFGEKSGFLEKPEDRFPEIKDCSGVNGLFSASVFSPKYFSLDDESTYDIIHQVLVDKEFNIVHDPNELYRDLESYPLSEELGYNGIINIDLLQRMNPKT